MKKLRIGFLLPRYSRHSKSYMPAVVQAVVYPFGLPNW